VLVTGNLAPAASDSRSFATVRINVGKLPVNYVGGKLPVS